MRNDDNDDGEIGSTPTRPIRIPPEVRRRRLARQGTWSICLSRTSDLADHPPGRSLVEAAEAAVLRAGHGFRDMGLFTARSCPPNLCSIRMVEQSDVYVAIVGHRYGSVVPDRPELSYIELEFETATKLGLPRLVFLLDRVRQLQAVGRQPVEHRDRQLGFRHRLKEEAGVTIARIDSPEALEIGLFQALIELRDELRDEQKARRRSR